MVFKQFHLTFSVRKVFKTFRIAESFIRACNLMVLGKGHELLIECLENRIDVGKTPFPSSIERFPLGSQQEQGYSAVVKHRLHSTNIFLCDEFKMCFYNLFLHVHLQCRLNSFKPRDLLGFDRQKCVASRSGSLGLAVFLFQTVGLQIDNSVFIYYPESHGQLVNTC